MGFVGVTPIITVLLFSNRSLVISVDKDNKFFDLITDFDVAPARVSTGYLNKLILPEHRTIYRTRTELLHNEMFEPFLDWVNKELAPAKWIHLGLIGKESSYAEFTQESLALATTDIVEVRIAGRLLSP